MERMMRIAYPHLKWTPEINLNPAYKEHLILRMQSNDRLVAEAFWHSLRKKIARHLLYLFDSTISTFRKIMRFEHATHRAMQDVIKCCEYKISLEACNYGVLDFNTPSCMLKNKKIVKIPLIPDLK